MASDHFDQRGRTFRESDNASVDECRMQRLRRKRSGESGRRQRRNIRAGDGSGIRGRNFRRERRNKQRLQLADGKRVHLGEFDGRLFPLGLFTFGHHFAKFAGMFAIEGFLEAFAERGILGIRDGHAAPGDGLQNGPVSANRKTKRQYHQPFGPLDQHEELIALG